MPPKKRKVEESNQDPDVPQKEASNKEKSLNSQESESSENPILIQCQNKEKPLPRKLTEDQDIVYKYMHEQNRPYSYTNVFDNLRGAIKKGQTTKVLDQLVGFDYLSCKDYGKTRIYWLNQAMLEEVSDNQIQDMEEKLKEIRQVQKEKLENLKQVENQIKENLKRLKLLEIQERIEEEKQKIQEIQQKLQNVNQTDLITDEERLKIEKRNAYNEKY